MVLAVAVLLVLLRTSLAEEEEEKVHPTKRAIATAATLIGSVVLIMTLYYFTNSSDKDIRKSTYRVICETISIFCGALIFDCLHDVLSFTLLQGVEGFPLLIWKFVIFLFLYSLLQILLGYLSGCYGSMVDVQEFERSGNMEKHKIIDQVENNLQCFAALMASITGFASINCWSTAQHLEGAEDSLHAFAVVPVALLVIFSIERFTAAIRHEIAMYDSQESCFERAWEREVVEAENNVMCLTISFTFTQAVRFQASGFMADEAGLDSLDNLKKIMKSHSAMLVLFVGTVLAVFVFLFSYYTGQVEEVELFDDSNLQNSREEQKSDDEVSNETQETALQREGYWVELRKRTATVVSLSTGMGFAWCYFFGTRWLVYDCVFLGRSKDDHSSPDVVLVSVLTALTLSFASFLAIVLLDKLADAEFTGPSVDDAIRQTISRIGILVGFAWEQSFSESVVLIAEQSDNPRIFRVILICFSIALVVPAWKFYLLPMAHHNGWKFGFVVDIMKLAEAQEHMCLKLANQEKFHSIRRRESRRPSFLQPPEAKKTICSTTASRTSCRK